MPRERFPVIPLWFWSTEAVRVHPKSLPAPFKTTTALLWLGPVLLLAIGALVLLSVVRRRRGPATEPELTPEQRVRAAKLLDGGDAGGSR